MKYKGFDHISINVSDFSKSDPFYERLLSFLGFKEIGAGDGYAGWSNGTQSIWIEQASKPFVSKLFHRKQPGVNHIAFRAESEKAVNEFHHKFLQKNKIPTLYGTPKEFPEYRKGYYAVYFEDPDRIKLEVMWSPED